MTYISSRALASKHHGVLSQQHQSQGVHTSASMEELMAACSSCKHQLMLSRQHQSQGLHTSASMEELMAECCSPARFLTCAQVQRGCMIDSVYQSRLGATPKPRGAYLGFNGGADGSMQLMQAPADAFKATPKLGGAYLSFNGGADGGVQLMKAGLQVAPVALAVALHEEAGGPEPGLLPAPRCRLPAGLQSRRHLLKQLLLQPLHALLHLHTSAAFNNMSALMSKVSLRKREEAACCVSAGAVLEQGHFGQPLHDLLRLCVTVWMRFSALGPVLIVDCRTIVVCTMCKGCMGTDMDGKAHEHNVLSSWCTVCRGYDNNVGSVKALRGGMQEHEDNPWQPCS